MQNAWLKSRSLTSARRAINQQTLSSKRALPLTSATFDAAGSSRVTNERDARESSLSHAATSIECRVAAVTRNSRDLDRKLMRSNYLVAR